MGTIDIFAKWDLEKNDWTQSDNLKDRLINLNFWFGREKYEFF